MEIRSYRHVFDLERRIYRIDALRLNPSGVPVRALGYLAGFLLLAALASSLPVLGSVLGVLPWFLRDAALPALAALAATVIRIEGRSCRHGAGALIRGWVRGEAELGRVRTPRTWDPPELVFLPDGSEGRLRRMTYSGPGVAQVHAAHGWRSDPRRLRRRRALVLVTEQEEGQEVRPRTIALDAGARLVVCPDAAAR